MKFTTFYFSGTGNTEWAAKEFNEKINEKGHRGELFSIEKEDVQETSFLEGVLLYINDINIMKDKKLNSIDYSIKIC